MATTKQAVYRFKVKEGLCDPFIVMEPAGREPTSERPLPDLDLAFFILREGISFEEAQRIADFLNSNLLYFAVTSFGDAEDSARDVRLRAAFSRMISAARACGGSQIKNREAIRPRRLKFPSPHSPRYMPSQHNCYQNGL